MIKTDTQLWTLRLSMLLLFGSLRPQRVLVVLAGDWWWLFGELTECGRVFTE